MINDFFYQNDVRTRINNETQWYVSWSWSRRCSRSISEQPTSLLNIQEAQIVIGTSCAGTGIDIQDVKNVIVVGLPYSIEQLLQWAGRCRGDGLVTVIVPSAHMKQPNELTSMICSIQLLAQYIFTLKEFLTCGMLQILYRHFCRNHQQFGIWSGKVSENVQIGRWNSANVFGWVRNWTGRFQEVEKVVSTSGSLCKWSVKPPTRQLCIMLDSSVEHD